MIDEVILLILLINILHVLSLLLQKEVVLEEKVFPKNNIANRNHMRIYLNVIMSDVWVSYVISINAIFCEVYQNVN